MPVSLKNFGCTTKITWKAHHLALFSICVEIFNSKNFILLTQANSTIYISVKRKIVPWRSWGLCKCSIRSFQHGWLMSKMCLKVVSKNCKEPIFGMMKFIDAIKFYSCIKSPGCVGIADVANDESCIAKLSITASVFTAELTVTLKYIELMNRTDTWDFSVCSNSFNALTASKPFNPSRSAIQA